MPDEVTYTDTERLCITVDDEALEYLPHMHGPASFTVVSQVERLPFRVSDICRWITR